MAGEQVEAGGSTQAHEWFTPWRFAAILGLFILAMFPDVILGGRTFIFRDFGLFGYPIAAYYKQSFWRHEVPLWNPLSNCGLPFLAQWNTLVLYPGSLFYLLLPLSWSLAVFNLLHLLLCGLAMYALAWNWTSNRLAATVAGLGFAFNGFTLNCLMWPNYIASLAWMPLVLLTVERAWRLGGRRVALAALVGAMQMLSGTPEIVLLTWVLLGAMWLLQLRCKEPARWTVTLRLAAVITLVTGLAAAQLLPFLDLLRFSQREQGVSNEEWSMPLTGWANFLVPLFRTMRTSAGVHLQETQGITSSYYLGISLTALALMAAWRIRKARVRLLAALTAASLVLALGPAAKAYTLLLKVFPPLGLVRFPIKFVMLPVVAVPLLAAFSVQAYLEAPPELKRRLWRFVWQLGLCFIAIIGLLIGCTLLKPAPDEIVSDTVLSGLSRAGFLIAILGLWFALGRVTQSRGQWRIMLGLVTLIWLDATTHAPRQNPTVERAVFLPENSPLTQLKPRPALGQSRAMLNLQAILAFRTKILTNAAAGYLLSRLTLYDNVNLLEGVPKVDGFFALELRKEREVRYHLFPTANTYRAPLADFLSVSQVTSATNLFVWTARSTYLPMATAGQTPLFLDPASALAALTSASFDPRATVLLQPEDEGRVTVRKQTSARILEAHWSAHRIALEVEAAEPSLVVLSQSFYHNWRALVGGKPARLLCANLAFQALEVPAGRQLVTLVYEDRTFYAGCAVSLLSLLICLILWLRGLWIAKEVGR